MKKGLRFALASLPVFSLTALIACGGDTPPPSPPPPPAPPPIASVAPVASAPVDAGPTTSAAPALAQPQIVTARQGTIRALAVQGRWTYWLTQSGDVKRAPTSGGPALKVATFGLASLAVSNGMIYVADYDAKKKTCTLYRINPDLSNKPASIGSQAGTLCDIVADDKRVAWGVQSGKKYDVTLFDKGDTKGKKLAPADATAGDDLALGPDAVYFDDGGQVITVPFDAKGKAKSIGQVAAPQVVFDLTYAGDRLFMVVQPAIDQFEGESLVSMPAAGGDQAVIVKSDSLMGNFASDAQNVYWSASGTKANDYKDGKIMKLALAAGSTPAVIAVNQSEPHGVAVDDENVYFSNDKGLASDADSDVLRLAK
ncbi:MAG: hypothetical protein ACRELY_32230 [Polyangiaceae bacterium]